jgi:hypothetical protein
VGKVWSEPAIFGKNLIRKIERKIFFTLEFSVKSLYATLIGFASKMTYERSDPLIYMKVSVEHPEALKEADSRVKVFASEGNRHLVGVPRWGPFTEILPKLAAQGVEFHDISGNDEIVSSVIGRKGSTLPAQFGRVLFQSKLAASKEKIRWVVLTRVKQLTELLQGISTGPYALEHIYDY